MAYFRNASCFENVHKYSKALSCRGVGENLAVTLGTHLISMWMWATNQMNIIERQTWMGRWGYPVKKLHRSWPRAYRNATARICTPLHHIHWKILEWHLMVAWRVSVVWRELLLISNNIFQWWRLWWPHPYISTLTKMLIHVVIVAKHIT